MPAFAMQKHFFRKLATAVLGVSIALPAVALARTQEEALALASRPGVWCEEFRTTDQSCTHILRLQRDGDQVGAKSYFLLKRDGYPNQPLKAVMGMTGTLRGGQFCMRPGELVRSLKVYAPTDRRPMVHATDQDLGDTVARRFLVTSSGAKRLANDFSEVCGAGPLQADPQFIPEARAAGLVLRFPDDAK